MIRAFQWDLARQVERLDVLCKLLPHYADWGYQELYLHLEDAVDYPSFPEIARADAFSQRQFARLVDSATKVGIQVVPIVNLLGHTQYLIKTPSLRDLNELRAANGSPLERGQICPLHPETLRVAEKLLSDIAPFCTAGKVHVGLDESFHIGKCPACNDQIARVGLARHFSSYVDRLHTIVSSLGLRMGMWADMLNFIPEAIPQLPKDIFAYDWYYYPFARHPRVEFFNFAESDLATPLQKHGVEYWGCPMNGAFRYEPLPVFSDRLANIRSWWQRCQRTKAGGFLVTSWEAYRLALETTTVVDAAAACLWLNPDLANDNEAMLAKGFARVFGKSGASKAARTALAADKYPFSGYARWETNERWNSQTNSKALAEQDFFKALSAEDLPPPLKTSIAFRTYLAEREVFIASCQKGVVALRSEDNPSESNTLAGLKREAKDFAKALQRGRKAARSMWRRTRNPKAHGQNESILDADSERWAAWTEWLESVARDSTRAFSSSPVMGAWQLTFVVHNFAPAVQRVAVSERQANGSWREIAARHTIEFLAAAAKPRGKYRRGFSVPVSLRDSVLKITVQGVGQVAIERISLTNGVAKLSPVRPSKRVVLGKKARRRGFPDLTGPVGPTSELELRF
ncbi:MAG: family 20 glycosylhydrolase [Nibricoccus sp.]